MSTKKISSIKKIKNAKILVKTVKKTSTKKSIKTNGKSNIKVEKRTKSLNEKIKELSRVISNTDDMYYEFGKTIPDLFGIKIYNVHFVEYKEWKEKTNVIVFTASSPEWAMGWCKCHTEAAPKEEIGSWWYYYVTEMEINNGDMHETWIACLDWNAKIITNTFHIDKGYEAEYAKEHVIYEDACGCAENEKDEEFKIKEKTEAAVNDVSEFVKNFFEASDVIVNKDGDFYKIFALVQDNRELKITDMEYMYLHKKFGVTAGNRILFYLAAKK